VRVPCPFCFLSVIDVGRGLIQAIQRAFSNPTSTSTGILAASVVVRDGEDAGTILKAVQAHRERWLNAPCGLERNRLRMEYADRLPVAVRIVT